MNPVIGIGHEPTPCIHIKLSLIEPILPFTGKIDYLNHKLLKNIKY